ncbi:MULTISPECIES: T9SS type A sorting domain-containing protein [Chitinophagaceae]
MKKLYTLMFPLLLLGSRQMANAQTWTRFYLQDFGNASYYASNSLVTYYNTNTGNSSKYSYNAIFNGGTANGVTVPSLIAGPPTGFTSYGPKDPNTQPDDGYYSISQHVGTAPNGTTYNLAGYGTVCWDNTTGPSGTANNGTGTVQTGLFMFVNADPTHTGTAGGSYFELPLQVLNIPGATYRVSTAWRDMDGTSSKYQWTKSGDWSNHPIPAFIGIDIRDGSKGSGNFIANIVNTASTVYIPGTGATVTVGTGSNAYTNWNSTIINWFTNNCPTSTVAGSWQSLATTFTLPNTFTGSTLYFNVYNSSPIPASISNITLNNVKFGTAGNDIGIDDVKLEMQTIGSLSGTVYTNDANGTGSSTTPYTASGLYAVLVDANGKVVQSVPVNSDGTYTFATNAAYDQYLPYAVGDIGMKILLSTTNPAVGTADFTTSSLPAGMANSGHRYSGQSFVSDKTDAVMPVTQTAGTVTGAVFYIESRPVAIDYTNELLLQPAVNTSITPILKGFDAEDGSTDITATSGGTTVVFNAVPANGSGMLLYDGTPITAGQEITGFQPSLLQFEFTGSGYTNCSFGYSFIDKAGIQSNIATYKIEIPYALPVGLLFFDVVLKNGIPYLQWTMTSEINNAEFRIQRSSDADNWSTIAYKPSAAKDGNSSNQLSYDYSDDAVSWSGRVYYRLLQVDLDGKSTPLPVRSIVVPSGGSGNVSVFPNPAVDCIRVTNVPSSGILRIVGMDGRVYHQQAATQNTEVLSVQRLVPGLYMLQIIRKDKTQTSVKFFKK